MSYLRLAMITLIWKQTVAVKWRESISIIGYRRHLLFRSVNSMHSEPFKIKAWSFFWTFFSPSHPLHWRPIENGSATHFWVATHQLGTIGLDNQRLNEDMRLNTSSLVRFGRVPEKTSESDMVLAKLHTDATLILVTSDWRNRVSLPSTWITILLYLRLSLASSFK